MEKLLSIVVPTYNVEKYLRRCLDSFCIEEIGDRMEVLVINDGSTDSSAEIAGEYVSKHPQIFRLVNKENGGHGSTINRGIEEAKGRYFKVVDSDDWVDEEALLKVLKTLRFMIKEDKKLDMLLSNYVYDKQGAKRKKTMSYRSAMNSKHITSWDGAIKFKKSQYILMHSVIYRTQMLKECGLELPKHTFYVDNLYVFKPLPSVKRLCYIDVDFYHYFIGREDQSVNEKVMIGRIDQHIKVAKIMIDEYSNMDIQSKKLDKYMLQYLDMMMCIASVMLILDGSREALKKKTELWSWLKENYPDIYKKLRYSIMGISMNLPTGAGRAFSKLAYKVTQKIFGFN